MTRCTASDDTTESLALNTFSLPTNNGNIKSSHLIDKGNNLETDEDTSKSANISPLLPSKYQNDKQISDIANKLYHSKRAEDIVVYLQQK